MFTPNGSFNIENPFALLQAAGPLLSLFPATAPFAPVASLVGGIGTTMYMQNKQPKRYGYGSPGYMAGGQLQRITPGALEVDANNSATADSVFIPGARVDDKEVIYEDFVFSNRIHNPKTGNSVAIDAKEILKKINAVRKTRSPKDLRTVSKLREMLEELKIAQETAKFHLLNSMASQAQAQQGIPPQGQEQQALSPQVPTFFAGGSLFATDPRTDLIKRLSQAMQTASLADTAPSASELVNATVPLDDVSSSIVLPAIDILAAGNPSNRLGSTIPSPVSTIATTPVIPRVPVTPTPTNLAKLLGRPNPPSVPENFTLTVTDQQRKQLNRTLKRLGFEPLPKDVDLSQGVNLKKRSSSASGRSKYTDADKIQAATLIASALPLALGIEESPLFLDQSTFNRYLLDPAHALRNVDELTITTQRAANQVGSPMLRQALLNAALAAGLAASNDVRQQYQARNLEALRSYEQAVATTNRENVRNRLMNEEQNAQNRAAYINYLNGVLQSINNFAGQVNNRAQVEAYYDMLEKFLKAYGTSFNSSTKVN